MNARERRQEIRTHLNDARALAVAGRCEEAVARVDAALAIDADNVAAQTLREEILSPDAPIRLKADPTSEQESRPENEGRPLVSAEGLARFERRARQRRIERRLEAARVAIGRRRFNEARAAVAEVRELDPARPELAGIMADLDAAEGTRAVPAAGGPLAAAAATFAGITLSASLIGNTGFLQSYPMTDIAALAPASETASLSAELAAEAPVATTGDQVLALSMATLGDPFVRTIADIGIERPVPAVVEPPPVVADVPTPSAPPAAALPVPAAAAQAIPAAAPLSAPLIPVAPVAEADTQAEDTRRVRAVLRQYQAAYDQRDARLAQVVWPGVNEAALARAFDDLESQTLTFDDCDVQLQGSTASARCTGSTRYVPKVGSGVARVEPLVWNFTLSKGASDWQIETARADP